MQERHTNRKRYFDEQGITTGKHVIPFIEHKKKVDKKIHVLEIGCGEGGNLTPFADLACERIVGIDLSEGKIENAKNYFKDHPHNDKLELIVSDIYDIEDLGKFDIIFTRDVLEHIHGQERFMEFVKKFMKDDGLFFLGFPPWQFPFGGHQQMCESKFLSKLPYFHILPKGMYAGILRLFKESEPKIEGLLEVKETGITIERFQRIIKKSNYQVEKRTFYLFNPNYEIKLGLKPRKQLGIITMIPFLRNFLISTNYYLLSVKK